MPWVRLRGVKDYFPMAALVDKFDGMIGQKKVSADHQNGNDSSQNEPLLHALALK